MHTETVLITCIHNTSLVFFLYGYVNNTTAEYDIYILILYIGCLSTPQLILSTCLYHMNTMQLIQTQYYPLLLLLLHCQRKALCKARYMEKC